MIHKKMKPEEEHCRSALHDFLLNERIDNLIWHDGTEPPDYFLDIEGERHAVEVTSIFPSVTLGKRCVSDELVKQELEREFEQLKMRVESAVVIDGVYSIRMKRTPNLKRLIPDIEAGIKDYVSETRELAVAARQRLQGGWSIQKRAANPPMLSFTSSTRDVMFESEIHEEMAAKLHEVIENKCHKMRNICAPCVLLLLDKYHFADYQCWAACLANESRQFFKWIMRIGCDGSCKQF